MRPSSEVLPKLAPTFDDLLRLRLARGRLERPQR